MLQVTSLNACDGLPVVFNFGPRLDECVKDDVAIVVDYGHSGQSVSLFGEDTLTVYGQNLSLSVRNQLKISRVFKELSNTYFPRLRP